VLVRSPTCPLLQVCLLDLDYNLPVQVRDSATGKEVEDLPESDVNKEYVLQRLAEDGDLDSSYNKQRANDTILKLQRTTPYYKVDHLMLIVQPVIKTSKLHYASVGAM